MTTAVVPSDTVLPAKTCVLRYALEQHAKARGNDVYAVFEDGSAWTFADLLKEVRAAGAGLQKLGVRQDDRVIVMMPNSALALKAMFAANYIGAVSVPINVAYKGRQLEHVITNSGAAVAIVHSSFLDEVLKTAPERLSTVLVANRTLNSDLGIGINGARVLSVDVLHEAGACPNSPERGIQPWDLQSIIYTSGTTGPSKGVLSTYMHSFSACNPDAWLSTREDDRHLLHMPIFHIGGAFIASMSLCVGASIAVVERFKTDEFWPLVQRLKVTAVFLLGAMATFLLKQAESANDKNHLLRMVIIVPLGKGAREFRKRFGVDVYTLFNMTEINTPLFSEVNPERPGVCGQPRPGIDVRIVDEHDCPVPNGEVGQLVVRTQAPWSMSHGYNNDAEATASAWRNGWFHTGDAFSLDENGDYVFVDRLKDTIRRRGENISSYEVEIELLGHPSIREAAVIPVPSEVSEDEVLVALSLVEGKFLEPEELMTYLEPRLAYFMLPRYIRFVEALPKTPTEKVQKHILRAEGVTANTWDREKAGFAVRRSGMEKQSDA